MICDWQVSGEEKKELWMSLELFFFPLPFETVLRYLFAALNIAPLHKV